MCITVYGVYSILYVVEIYIQFYFHIWSKFLMHDIGVEIRQNRKSKIFVKPISSFQDKKRKNNSNTFIKLFISFLDLILYYRTGDS